MNSFPLTKVGKHSIFMIRKKRSNAGKVRGPRAGPKLVNEGVMLPVPKGGAIVGVNYKGRNVHQSARGKLYVLGKTGRKMYTVHMEKPVPNGGAIVGVNYKGRNVHQSARGKMYVLGKTGRKMYTVHMEKPVRKTRKNKNVKRGPRHLPRNVNLFE
jgi:hypothetical protein